MTYKEAQAWLGRAYRSQERIKAKEIRIRHWTELATSITSTLKDVAVAPSMPGKKVEKYAVEIADIEEEIQEEIWALKRLESEISKAISELIDVPNYAAVLEMRYTSYMRWEEIAVALGYTLRWTMTIHERAVRKFAEKKAL